MVDSQSPGNAFGLLDRVVRVAATVFTKRHAPLLFGLLVNVLLIVLALVVHELMLPALLAVTGVSLGTFVAWWLSVRANSRRLNIRRSEGVDLSDVMNTKGAARGVSLLTLSRAKQVKLKNVLNTDGSKKVPPGGHSSRS